jgi:Tol biopolymer transport system component
MKFVNGYRMMWVLVGFVVAIVLSGGRAKADFTFSEPMNLGPTVNSSDYEFDPCISTDGLMLLFNSNRPGGYGGADLWVARRATKADPWSEAVNLGPIVNSSAKEEAPSISDDGLSLYFSSNRPGGYGGYSDLWVTTRTTKEDDWGPPVNLGSIVNSSASEHAPSISANGLSLFFAEHFNGPFRPGGFGSSDLWVTTRTTPGAEWGTPMNLGLIVNSSSVDEAPSISADGLTLFFTSTRPGSSAWDQWMTIRATIEADWVTPINLGPLINSSADDINSEISADGSTLYFSSDRPAGLGVYDIWQSTITPIVDLNGDGIVDSADMCIMVNHWGESYPLCDIGPTPLGDGIVDVQDLIVLAEHLFEEVSDSTLIAHWKLDETEGDVAYDSAAICDGILIGDPVWQPDGGVVAGALQFDGIDDYISTNPVLNPTDGAFSVLAWIKGGAPGQVIISQEGGSGWLMADIANGALRTDLRTPETTSRDPKPAGPPLICSTVVTDVDWHRVGFVRDDSDRVLYVDDIEVARDTAETLESASGGLYIGAASALQPGGFFSGLIDDVRIYNRAVEP